MSLNKQTRPLICPWFLNPVLQLPLPITFSTSPLCLLFACIPGISSDHSGTLPTMDPSPMSFYSKLYRYSSLMLLLSLTVSTDLILNGITCVLAWLQQPTPGFLSWSANSFLGKVLSVC